MQTLQSGGVEGARITRIQDVHGGSGKEETQARVPGALKFKSFTYFRQWRSSNFVENSS